MMQFISVAHLTLCRSFSAIALGSEAYGSFPAVVVTFGQPHVCNAATAGKVLLVLCSVGCATRLAELINARIRSQQFKFYRVVMSCDPVPKLLCK